MLPSAVTSRAESVSQDGPDRLVGQAGAAQRQQHRLVEAVGAALHQLHHRGEAEQPGGDHRQRRQRRRPAPARSGRAAATEPAGGATRIIHLVATRGGLGGCNGATGRSRDHRNESPDSRARALLIVNRHARSGAEQAEAAAKALAEAGLDAQAFEAPEGMSCAESVTTGLAPPGAASTGW